MAVRHTMTIRASMTAYSTAVGPSSLTRKRCTFKARDFMGSSSGYCGLRQRVMRGRAGAETRNTLSPAGSVAAQVRRRARVSAPGETQQHSHLFPSNLPCGIRVLDELAFARRSNNLSATRLPGGTVAPPGPWLCAHGLATGLPFSRMRGLQALGRAAHESPEDQRINDSKESRRRALPRERARHTRPARAAGTS